MSSLDNLRKRSAKLQSDKAALHKKISDEEQKILKANKEIDRIQRGITKNTSASSLSMKQRQIQTQMERASKAQKSIADLQKRLSGKMNEISRTLNDIQRAELAEAKKRQQQEIKHQREVTREKERQARIHRQMSPIPVPMLPEKLTILFLSASPADQGRLQIDEEMRLVHNKIRASEHRDSMVLESRWAVQSFDFLQAMNETNPTIVHLSGHSSPDFFCFSDGQGGTKNVAFEALINAMAVSSDKLRLIVFNSCNSLEAAEKAAEHFEFTIGMGAPISDDAARFFSAQFYSALGFSRSVSNSFEQAKSQLMLEGTSEENTPFLFFREGSNPEETILVRPQ